MTDETDAPAAWHYARDGQKVGPVGFDALRQLAASGGLRPGDLVWTAGMAQWTPAAVVPALGAAFGTVAYPPPMPAGPPGPPGPHPPGMGAYAPPGIPMAHAVAMPPPGYPGGPPGADLGADTGMRWLIPVGRSGWAIAAGYLGLFSVLGCVAPIAIIVSVVAIRDIRKNPRHHGMGRAVFGLVMGILGTIGLVAGLIALAAGR